MYLCFVTLNSEEMELNELDKAAIERLISYMNENCLEPFDIKKHASMIYFSTSKLNKVFKLHMGVGPGSYYKRIRLQKAKELMSQQQLTWTEVSGMIGYADLPSFSKAFKRTFGYSPKQIS